MSDTSAGQEAEYGERLYFSIGEVAQMLGVPTSMIRFWETEFPHIKPRKNARGDRRYTRKEIEDIKLIYQLVKEKGYTLQGAKEYIKARGAQKRQETIQTLQDIRSFLIDLKQHLPE